MATEGKASKERIPAFDYDLLPELSTLLGIDAVQMAKEMEENEEEIRAKMQKGFNSEMSSEAKRLKTFVTYESYSSWTPPEMAAAGFYFTGVKSGVQCFCCSLILFGTSLRKFPIENHKKFHPHCEFLLGKDVGNIAKYDVRVKNPGKKLRGDKARYQNEETRLESFKKWPFYARGTSPHALSTAGFVFTAYCNDSVFANEELRLDTFKNWPHKSRLRVAALARAGLFYTGIEDMVQCFSCGGCLEKWKEEDDPFEDHTKYFPNCPFLQNMKSAAEVIPDLQSHGELPEVMETTTESNLENSEAVNSTGPEVAQGETQWFQEAKSLSEQLRAVYTTASFRHMSLPELSSKLATDHLLGCDLSIISKHISSTVQEPMVLPEVFANLKSVMCVEGETGSGKTVLLKKIAFLWASGCCPLLNRFQLVFYLSLNSTRRDQGLASIICDQLLETEGTVTELCLMNIIRQLKNQVLFLLDDYKEMCSFPQVIEKLIKKNHSLRSCLLIAIHTNRARDIRRYLDTILEIQAFPFYNTIFLLRRLFPHNITRLQKIMVHFGKNKNLQVIQKTPLFVAAICINWFQCPFDQSFDDVAVFKSYMECLFLKHKSTAELFKAIVSSCGELALKGFFSSCFEFSGDDLAEVGVDEDEDLTMCLMSKFTAQRLRPVYQFLNPTFQEFLAAIRLNELLDSDRQDNQDLGLYYLKQIKSPMMAVYPYENFLNYVSSHPSSKVGPKLVSHLLHLVDNKESLEDMSENDDYLKHRPDISANMEFFRIIWQMTPDSYFSLVSKHLLVLALKIAYRSNSVAACSPFILEFLQGRTLTLDVLNLQYFLDHPESLLLLKSIVVSIQGKKRTKFPNFSSLEACWDKLQAPTIDQDYASVFESMKEFEQNIAEKEEKINSYLDLQHRALPDISAGYWKLPSKQYKIPLLQVQVTSMDAVDQEMLRVLMIVFSASQHIELHLNHSSGFIESIRPALELNKTSVTKCSIEQCELCAPEQELLLALPSLESLNISETIQLPDQIFPNLDKFLCLKELSVKLADKPNVFSVIPEEFPNLHHMEKLVIHILAENNSSKLVTLIQNSPNLHVFRLKCESFSDFESLMTALTSCEKLEEIWFSGPFFKAIPFAYTLGSLNHLEELKLPTGDGIRQVAKLIIQQCQQLQCLRVLSFYQTLNDDSVMEIAKVAISGGFQKLENLNLSINHEITEEGFRNFFRALDNLPNLQELTISRHFTACIKAQATTVKALSQCVSRLPNLTRLQMLSWLLDAEDMALLNAMKQRHPKSKHLIIIWKWILPFSPVIQK
ncbi:Baculoviral IAP repeat-containing protein 1 [Sciurus carolinensis]|uniref:Baculoviral IAP repeat-containing protein 1 n=1 Tax=Sciurus carolinensis TaxID=30640 RepID=A0AA41MVF8_SCICA|nr:Baculoviral IAP repeat-containing protein 1 [Sciurus carolinensis]